MNLPLDAYEQAAREARWHDAATDAALHARWREGQDPLARALLILAAAHLHASTGNRKGATAKLERAQGYLDACQGDLAEQLREHTKAALARAASGEPLPPHPLTTPDPES